MDGLAEWHVVAGGWLQVFQDTDRAGATWVTMEVTTLDDQLAELNTKGIPVGPTTIANYVKIATVVDLDGNHLTFVEPLPAHT